MGVLGLDRATVLGQSLGGGVAMQLSYQHPELVERLVLVGSGGLGREVSWILRILTLPGAELLMPLLFPSVVADRGNDVSKALHDQGWRAPHVAEMWRAYASLAGAPNRHAFIRTLRGVIDPGGQTVSANDRLYLAAAMPTLIIWGDEDPVIPVAHAHAAHEAIPGSRLELFEGVGHFPHVEEPTRFVEVLEDFMESSDPGPLTAGAYRDLLVAQGPVDN
jgi:pimeloyl-ACP methyl ester carboxylesterase